MDDEIFGNAKSTLTPWLLGEVQGVFQENSTYSFYNLSIYREKILQSKGRTTKYVHKIFCRTQIIEFQTFVITQIISIGHTIAFFINWGSSMMSAIFM